jgi:GGDEF domain-containing protein
VKISFDYWGTISTPRYQAEAKACLRSHEVYVVTRGKYIDDARAIAERIGIKPENVISTEGKDKGPMLAELGIDLHYDDDQNQIDAILAYGKTACLRVNPKSNRHLEYFNDH